MTSTSKRLLLGTNLKMYKTAKETAAYLSELRSLVDGLQDQLLLFVIPSFVALPSAVEETGDTILLGAQNMFYEEKGAFTGEISPAMLKELGGISIIEIGHSERRHIFGETSYDCNRKVLSAAAHQFIPLLCIGETAQERDYGITEEILAEQLKIGLYGLDPACPLWIAYEPVWAIGETGTAAAPDLVLRNHGTIRTILKEILGETGESVPILYGGSVSPSNLNDLLSLPDVDGLFIGRSAWQSGSFYQLIRQALPVWHAKWT